MCVFENQINSMINFNVKSGYFFYDMFFYATYKSVGVLFTFATILGTPLRIELSTINRVQNFKNKTTFDLDHNANPKFFSKSSNKLSNEESIEGTVWIFLNPRNGDGRLVFKQYRQHSPKGKAFHHRPDTEVPDSMQRTPRIPVRDDHKCAGQAFNDHVHGK